MAHDGSKALELAARRAARRSCCSTSALPGMDGYEVCRRLRAQGLTDTRIIAMTGYGQDKDRQRAMEAGFDEHTVKPVEFSKLTKLLSTAGC